MDPQLPKPPAAVPARAGKGALTALFVTVLLDLLGFGMILPLLPFYPQELGVSEVQIGWLFACYSLAQLVASPLVGRVSDRLGRRPVILVLLLLSAVSHLVFALADTFTVMIAARSSAGVAAASYGVAQAYIADVTTQEERSKGMGLLGAAFGLGFVLGPALGGFLGRWGHQAVPLGAAALTGLNLVLAVFLLPESLPRAARTRPAPGSALPPPEALSPVTRGLIGLFFAVTFGFALMESTLALYCQEAFGFGQVETSWLFVFLGVVLVVVQGGLVGRLVKRFGERRLIPLGIALIGAGLFTLPFAEAPWLAVLLVATALLAIGAGLHNPSSLGLLSRLTPRGAQGRTLGVSRSAGALARVLGPLAGTWIYAELGIAWPFGAAGLLMVLCVGWALWLVGRAPATPGGA